MPGEQGELIRFLDLAATLEELSENVRTYKS